MNLLLKGGTLVSPSRIQVSDLLVQDGKIKLIKDKILPKPDVEERDASGFYILPGIIDLNGNYPEESFGFKASKSREEWFRQLACRGVTTIGQLNASSQAGESPLMDYVSIGRVDVHDLMPHALLAARQKGIRTLWVDISGDDSSIDFQRLADCIGGRMRILLYGAEMSRRKLDEWKEFKERFQLPIGIWLAEEEISAFRQLVSWWKGPVFASLSLLLEQTANRPKIGPEHSLCCQVSGVFSHRHALSEEDEMHLVQSKRKRLGQDLPFLELAGMFEDDECFLRQFVKWTAANPAKTVGIYPQKGSLAAGSDADLLLLSKEGERGNNPAEVIISGRVAAINGQMTETALVGQQLPLLMPTGFLLS